MPHILIADDEPSICNLLQRGLADYGYTSLTAHDGQQALRLLQTTRFDLALLDIRMPLISGIELCQRLRQTHGYDLPIIMLTALGTTDDIVQGLKAGADDYIVKPFRFAELQARIEALLRRSQQPDTLARSFADLQLDPTSHRATRCSTTIYLSSREYRLLDYLMANHDRTLSRQELLREVWDRNFDTSTNVVDVYVRYLRAKIDDPFPTPLIHTVIGQGYRFGL